MFACLLATAKFAFLALAATALDRCLSVCVSVGLGALSMVLEISVPPARLAAFSALENDGHFLCSYFCLSGPIEGFTRAAATRLCKSTLYRQLERPD